MAKNTYKSNTFKKTKKKKQKTKINLGFLQDRRFQLSLGFFLFLSSFFLFVAFFSYLFTGTSDQSVVQALGENDVVEMGREVDNWLGMAGAVVGHFFIFKGFGIASFLLVPLLFVLGYKLVFKINLVPIYSAVIFTIFFMFWISTLLGYIFLISNGEGSNYESLSLGYLCGGIGYSIAIFSDSLIGWGTFLVLGFFLIIFMIYFFNITQLFGFGDKDIASTLDDEKEKKKEEEDEELFPDDEDEEDLHPADEEETFKTNEVKALELDVDEKSVQVKDIDVEIEGSPVEHEPQLIVNGSDKKVAEKAEPEFTIEEVKVEEKLGDNVENYDPTLDLRDYKYPTLELLNIYDSGDIQVSKEELKMNKDKIVETLVNFKIGINSIKATIGPTVTLYEIVPEAGVKISKIKNLEDDIALNLAALGIRIIAPIPGKGTIGIEVPNKNREMVGIRSVLSTEKFLKSDRELPVVLGKTISNEVLLGDLTKMPHLLMAGATGQGKSVGINVILASLLYKKHPSQLKFILVDPKKVELSLYNKIERHFLAKLPNNEDAIITDTRQVVHTLNSLCIEMDNRYNLLKDAGARNLKEYNAKFVKRRLNPENGHRYLPYIVLVMDELADLMMTAGKEVETPIARLAQLARAIGIHLIVATQRPSVNVITGIIKANFPTRLSFRVTSKVDSRTILDTGGAEQLVGMGDMLYSQGSDIVRLQCPFVDTEEIEKICEFIGSQRGYESAYELPEYEGEESSASVVDLDDRDALFDEAARLIVSSQQGSTSLIQRKMKLGYNRAGRLIDQLEAAGIVGPFEGSKAREVLIQDEYALEQLLNDLNSKTNNY